MRLRFNGNIATLQCVCIKNKHKNVIAQIRFQRYISKKQ